MCVRGEHPSVVDCFSKRAYAMPYFNAGYNCKGTVCVLILFHCTVSMQEVMLHNVTSNY